MLHVCSCFIVEVLKPFTFAVQNSLTNLIGPITVRQNDFPFQRFLYLSLLYIFCSNFFVCLVGSKPQKLLLGKSIVFRHIDMFPIVFRHRHVLIFPVKRKMFWRDKTIFYWIWLQYIGLTAELLIPTSVYSHISLIASQN